MTRNNQQAKIRSTTVIAIGFVLNVSILALVAVTGLLQMEGFRDEISQMVEQDGRKVSLFYSLHDLVMERQVCLGRLFVYAEKDLREQHLTQCRLVSEKIAETRNQLRTEVAGSVMEAPFESMRQPLERTLSSIDRLETLVGEDRLEAAGQLMISEVEDAETQLYARYAELLPVFEHMVTEAIRKVTEKRRETILLMLILAAATLLVSAIIGITILRRVAAIERRFISEIEDRLKLESELTTHKGNLEQQVAERTQALEKANKKLESQMAVREYAEKVLSREKERAQVTLASIGDAVITTDAVGNIENMNVAAEKLTGWSFEAARGKPLEQIYDAYLEQESNDRITVDGAGDQEQPRVLRKRDGDEIYIKQTESPIRNDKDSALGRVLVFHDVTRARELAKQLSWQANHDALTGLLNRHEFGRRLAQTLDNTRRDGGEHAVLFLDLDRFKIVNDTCGHVAGDELLRQLSRVLQNRLRSHDILARLGGDEFCVLLQDCPLERAIDLANEIRIAVSDYRYAWGNHTFQVGVSIGIVPISSVVESRDRVLSAADKACYLAKDKGRNCIYVYGEDGDDQQTSLQAQWVSRINDALEKGQFVLYSQAVKATSEDEDLRYLEVLLRMRDDSGKLIIPDAFLGSAERYELWPRLDRWVLEETLKWIASRNNLSFRFLVAINISAQSILDKGFPDAVEKAFQRTGVPPERVCFEVSENAVIGNLTEVIDLTERLRKMNCRFALDDFGSGLSSFDYLKSLPFDYLKIDGGYIGKLFSDPVAFAMVKSMNDIVHVLGRKTIAENVANDALLQLLEEVGVDFMQGYGVSLPVPLLEVEI